MKRVLSLALAAVACSCVVMAIETVPALAMGAPIQITQDVNMRSGPGTSFPRVGGIYAGQSPDFVCWTTGENIGGVDVWFDVNANGASGYYASYYDNSSYATDGQIISKYGIPQCGTQSSAPPVQGPTSNPQGPTANPQSGTAPVFGTMNDQGGVYWRGSPSWGAAEVSPGNGFYPGTSIRVSCYQAGSTVPGSSNTMWVQASWVSGPGHGSGWINEHFVSDNVPINQAAPGVPPCNTIISMQGVPASVYFSPYEAGSHEVQDPSVLTLSRSQWYSSGCAPSATSAALRTAAGRPITTLAGWSLGRVGVIRYLNAAPDQQLRQVSYVLLIDPGSFGELTCDRSLGAGNALARWLATNQSAHLVVISSSQVSQLDGSSGIQRTYFNDIRRHSTPPQLNLRARVLTCNYTFSHQQAFGAGRYWISHQIGTSSCPTLHDGTTPFVATAAWHP